MKVRCIKIIKPVDGFSPCYLSVEEIIADKYKVSNIILVPITYEDGVTDPYVFDYEILVQDVSTGSHILYTTNSDNIPGDLIPYISRGYVAQEA